VIPPYLPCWHRRTVFSFQGSESNSSLPLTLRFPFSIQTNPKDKVNRKPLQPLPLFSSHFLSLLTREITPISVILSRREFKNCGSRLLTPVPASRPPQKVSPLHPSSRHNRIPLHVARRSISAIISRSPLPHATNHLSISKKN
jgi:hypothetical protein